MELLLLVLGVLGGCAGRAEGRNGRCPVLFGGGGGIPGERKNKQKKTLSRPSSAQEQLDTFRIHIPVSPSSH